MSSSSKPIIPAPLPTSNIDRTDRKECYRTNNSLGISLVKTLEDMTARGRITPDAAEKILINFDMLAAAGLATATPRLNFKAENLKCYKVAVGGVNKFKLVNATVNVTGLQGMDAISATVPLMGLIAYPSSSVIRKTGSVTTKKSGATNPPNPITPEVIIKTADNEEDVDGEVDEESDGTLNETMDDLDNTIDSEACSTFLLGQDEEDEDEDEDL